MRTPPGEWTVEILRARVGAGCRVRRRAIVGADSGRAGHRSCSFTVDDVFELLEPRFADLAEVAG